MTTIKLGNLTLRSWTFESPTAYLRETITNNGEKYGSVWIVEEVENCWHCSFHYAFKPFTQLFGDPIICGTLKEAKQNVDQFLIRMSKLTAFF